MGTEDDPAHTPQLHYCSRYIPSIEGVSLEKSTKERPTGLQINFIVHNLMID